MAYTPTSLSVLLEGLKISETQPNHAEILKHASHVLKTNRTNSQAIHTKVVALLHLDRYEDVLRTLEATPLPEADFERTYALYKVGRLEEALKVARESKLSSKRARRGLAHVEAQAAYRLERFHDALNIYKTLIDSKDFIAANEKFDLSVNRTATEAQLLFSGCRLERRKATSEELSAFETAYNTACVHIARNEFPQASMLLRKSRDLCQALDFTEDEKREEMAPVIAQEVYVLLKQGKLDAAMEKSRDLDIRSISDASVKYIASNNDIACRVQISPNPYLSTRLYEETVTKQLAAASAKPFNFQTRVLTRNKLGLDLQVAKYNAVSSQAKHIKDESSSVYAAAAEIGGRKGAEARKVVDKLIAQDRKNIGFALLSAQMKLDVGNITGAIETVQGLLTSLDEKDKYMPGLVGLLVALYRQQGRKENVKKLLSEASEFSKKAEQPDESLLLAAALARLTSERSEDLLAAGELFTSIRTPAPFVSAGLVAAYATIEPKKAEPHISGLPAVEQLIKGIDVDALEAAGIPLPSKKRGIDDVAPSSKSKQPAVKKKRTRKARLPKDYDPANPKKIDPERWLPMRDRSYYRPKGGKKDKRRMMAQGMTQGGRAEEEKPEVTAEVPKPAVVKPVGGGGGAAKKKKKKGGKW